MIKIDESKLDRGLIGACYDWNNPDSLRVKIHISQQGIEYHYNLGKTMQYYPMQLGNGAYYVNFLKQKEPESGWYDTLYSKGFWINMSNPLDIFLQSNVNMPFTDDSEYIKVANELKTFEKIREYMWSNFKYDRDFAEEIKASNGKYNYVPWLNKIWRDKKDVCFGLTSMFNSMLRSQGIRAKMIHGYHSSGAYHCWSEVLINNEWVIIDITFDISMKKRFVVNQKDYGMKYFY